MTGRPSWRQHYLAAHPEFARKERARQQLRHAVRSGVIVKPTTCPRCGAEHVLAREMHAHHPDHDKPLDVEWMCRRCHEPITAQELRDQAAARRDWLRDPTRRITPDLPRPV